MVVLLIINESFKTRKGMFSNKICQHSERKNGAGCHPKQVILFRSWYVGNSQTIWWLKWLFITSVLNSDHQPPTGLSSNESHTIPQRNLVRQTQTSATLSLNALLSSCSSVCVFCASPRWRFYTEDPTRYFALQDGCRGMRWIRYVEKQSAWCEWPYCRQWGSVPGTLL